MTPRAEPSGPRGRAANSSRRSGPARLGWPPGARPRSLVAAALAHRAVLAALGPAALALLSVLVALVTPAMAAGDTDTAAIPEHAWAVLELVHERFGAPPRGYAGGRVFHNRERRLPRGQYREYDVHPRREGQDRGPERIVVERRTGRAWYTPDHYRTFVPMVAR